MVARRDILKRGAGGLGALVVGAGVAHATDTQPQPEPPRKWVLLVLDRSGSMLGMEAATINGVNDEYVGKLRGTDNLLLGIIQFDATDKMNIYETRDFESIDTITPLERHEFIPSGGTPLLAAFVDGVHRLERVVRPQDRALLVIQTDGGELDSPPEITTEVVQRLKEAKEAEGNWTFAFMGAGMDAWGESAKMGVSRGSSYAYVSNIAGTHEAYATASAATTAWAASDDQMSANFFAQSGGGSAVAADGAIKIDWGQVKLRKGKPQP